MTRRDWLRGILGGAAAVAGAVVIGKPKPKPNFCKEDLGNVCTWELKPKGNYEIRGYRRKTRYSNSTVSAWGTSLSSSSVPANNRRA